MNNYRVTDYYKSNSFLNPSLERQFIPDDRESVIKDYEISDPLDEKRYLVAPRLVHRYKDRVLLLVTDNCLLYCRHCFRRDFINRDLGEISTNEIDAAIEYIKKNSDIHEILLSGGDPLTIDIDKLEYIFNRIRNLRRELVIRIGSRVPIVDPHLISDKLINILGKASPVWLAIQCNHSDELTDDVKRIAKKLTREGINIVNQSVLLQGVNDSVEILKKLSYKLIEFGIKPYYLFQGDLARGTSHLRVPLEKGLDLVNQLRNEVSGLAMPVYAVDIPGGGGKIPLTRDFIIGEDDNYYYLQNHEGFKGRYPKE